MNEKEILNKEEEIQISIISSIEEKINEITNKLNKLKQDQQKHKSELYKIKSKLYEINIKVLRENGKNNLLEKCKDTEELYIKYEPLYTYWKNTFLQGLSDDTENNYCKFCTGDPIDGCKGCDVKKEAWEEFKKIYNL